MLVNSLKWQREYKPWSIVPDDVLGELKNEGKLYHNGFDKYGRPAIYMKPRHDTTGAKERYIRILQRIFQESRLVWKLAY